LSAASGTGAIDESKSDTVLSMIVLSITSASWISASGVVAPSSLASRVSASPPSPPSIDGHASGKVQIWLPPSPNAMHDAVAVGQPGGCSHGSDAQQCVVGSRHGPPSA
jgi:hypothetical protein